MLADNQGMRFSIKVNTVLHDQCFDVPNTKNTAFCQGEDTV